MVAGISRLAYRSTMPAGPMASCLVTAMAFPCAAVRAAPTNPISGRH